MWSLFDIVDDKLTGQRELSAEKLYAGIFRPTDASIVLENNVYGNCARQVYFNLRGMRKPITNTRANWKFAFGDKYEDIFIEMMKRAGLFHSDHVRIAYPFGPNNEYQISGEMDVVGEKDNEPFIVELKTIRGYTATKKCIQGYGKSHQYKHQYTLDHMEAAPKFDHLLQVMPYQYYGQYILPEKTGVKINESRICYLSADTMERSEFSVTFEERGGLHIPVLYRVESKDSQFATREIELKSFSIEDIFSRFIYIAKHLESNTIPACDYSYEYSETEIEDRLNRGVISTNKAKKMHSGEILGSDWQCSYCQYRELCKELPVGKVSESAVDLANAG